MCRISQTWDRIARCYGDILFVSIVGLFLGREVIMVWDETLKVQVDIEFNST